MKTNENGRSMVEMLGVLAIIGVLSVGGIYGYTVAMRKYKANEIVQTASMLATMAHAANAGAGDSVQLANSGLNKSPGGTAVTMWAVKPNSETDVSIVNIGIESDTSGDLCKAIKAIAPTGSDSDQAKRAGYYIRDCGTTAAAAS